MANNLKTQSLNMALQAGKIKSLFPASALSFNQNSLIWKYTITPSPLSASYEIKLSYTKGKHPNVNVINQILALHEGAEKLPHVYNTEKQWLCLYYRKGREWNRGMFISDTIIPWACEWLYHYELWVCTGLWHGGGIHQETEAEKQASKQKENIDETSRNNKRQ